MFPVVNKSKELPQVEQNPKLIDECNEITVRKLNYTNGQYFIFQFECLQIFGHHLRRMPNSIAVSFRVRSFFFFTTTQRSFNQIWYNIANLPDYAAKSMKLLIKSDFFSCKNCFLSNAIHFRTFLLSHWLNFVGMSFRMYSHVRQIELLLLLLG